MGNTNFMQGASGDLQQAQADAIEQHRADSVDPAIPPGREDDYAAADACLADIETRFPTIAADYKALGGVSLDPDGGRRGVDSRATLRTLAGLGKQATAALARFNTLS